MDPNAFPTKGNLILNKNTLKLSEQGYDLLDKKRIVLVREIMELNEMAVEIQKDIERVFAEAYLSLQQANMEIGISRVESLSYGVPQDTSVKIRERSVMGVEIPIVSFDAEAKLKPFFGFGHTSTSLDAAATSFIRVKELTIQLSMIENAAYRLAVAIKKTQRRANALKNVTIPKYRRLTKEIAEVLEEHDRDEFTRLKVAKKINSHEEEAHA